MRGLWQVVYVDVMLSLDEEYIICKIVDLFYIFYSCFIKVKLEV